MIINNGPHWSNSLVRLFSLEEKHVTADYVRWMADPAVLRYLESRFASHDAHTITQFVSRHRQSNENLLCGIHSCQLDRYVGNIKLGPIDFFNKRAEVGIMIGDREAWGIGVGTAAISTMCSIAKEDLGLRKITAGCYGSNVGSQKAFQNAGFEIEAKRKQHFIFENEDDSLILLAKFI